MSWWEGAVGQKVQGYLVAAGLVIQERRATGDPASVPRCVLLESGQASGRGSRSNMPDVLLKFIDVERFLKECCTAEMARLFEFVYVQGMSTENRVRYVLDVDSAGQAVAWSEAMDPVSGVPPIRHFGLEHGARPVFGHDWDGYPWVMPKEVRRAWRIGPRGFLEWQHQVFGMRLARFLGIM